MLTNQNAKRFDGDICDDLGRTFPTHGMFAAAPSLPQLDAAFDDDSMLYSCTSVGQRELLQILRAYVAFDHAIGYCQGMNFLAANLLMVIGNPEVTFWSLVQVMKSVKGLFAHGLPLYNLCLDLFGQQCRRYLPTIAGHLERQKTQLVTFAGAWFNTLFANGVVPIPLMHRIWDLFLFNGLPVIFQVALAILKACEGTLLLPPNPACSQPANESSTPTPCLSADAILQREGEDIVVYLSALPQSLLDNPNALLKSALAFTLAPEDLTGLPR